jgi:hypothetical protein
VVRGGGLAPTAGTGVLVLHVGGGGARG